MNVAKCFKCGQSFEGKTEDDFAGDGECPKCQERSKRIAFKVDIDMANKRAARALQPTSQDKVRAAIIQDMIHDPSRRINMRELGIEPQD